MKNWLVGITLLAMGSIGQAATYNIVTLTSDLPEDLGKVYPLQIIVDQNQNITKLYLPALNPTTDCPRSLTPQDFMREFVTMKFEDYEKREDGTCKYKGRSVLNVGIYDSLLLKAAGPAQNNMIPFWVDYLINGISMNRSEKLDLQLAYNYEKKKWEVIDHVTNRVVSNIQFVVNKVLGINIGVARHIYKYVD